MSKKHKPVSRASLEQRTKFERLFLDLFYKQAIGSPATAPGPHPIVFSSRFPSIELPSQSVTLKIQPGVLNGGQLELLVTLLPLVFLSAFKSHDMIFEWVLYKNRIKLQDKHTGFFEKVDIIKKAKRNQRLTKNLGILSEENAVLTPFIRLYEVFRAPRNTMIHGHEYHLKVDEGKKQLEIQTSDGPTILNQTDLVTYCRLILSTLEILGMSAGTPRYAALYYSIKQDLHSLDRLHKVTNLKRFVTDRIEVHIPRDTSQSIMVADLLANADFEALPYGVQRALEIEAMAIAEGKLYHCTIVTTQDELTKHSALEVTHEKNLIKLRMS